QWAGLDSGWLRQSASLVENSKIQRLNLTRGGGAHPPTGKIN
ncbi:hypothetical protein PanWU01x14_276060, partial [Parasponia andersonii]